MSNEDYNNEEEQVEESADLSTDNQESYEQDDSAGEGESEASEESSEQRTTETSEQRIARLKRQLEREERKSGIKSDEGGKEKPKAKEEKGEVDNVLMDRLDRGDLRYEGVKDKGEQDIIIEYAKWKNMDVLDAMNSAAVKAELKEYRAKSATPRPSTRTAQGTRDDVAFWADQMKKGNRAPTAELRTKAREYLAKRK
jgi:hypothetical protein